ncbi:MAG: phenylpyruvate tautomerase MIF-related protein [Angelakisella sp.]
MPFISIHTNLSPDSNKKNVIKAELGRLISIIPGKSEPVLMVEFVDGSTFFMGGVGEGNCAMVDVRCYKTAPFEANKEFTQEVFQLLERELNIPQGRIYLTLMELPTWGTKGTLK